MRIPPSLNSSLVLIGPSWGGAHVPTKASQLTSGNSGPLSGPTGCWSGCLRMSGLHPCADWPARARPPQGRPHPPQSWGWVVRSRKLERNDKELVFHWGSAPKTNNLKWGRKTKVEWLILKYLIFEDEVSLVTMKILCMLIKDIDSI